MYSNIIKTVEMIFSDRELIMRLMLLLIITALRLVACEEEGPVSTVNRRLNGDTFQYFNSNIVFCSSSDPNNLTLLVGDERCVNNQDLFNECEFAFIPSNEPSTLRITLSLSRTEVEELITMPTFTSNNTLVDARIASTNTLQTINESFCQITTLEIYRGSRLSTVISHNGFSLSNGGTLEVNISSLSYRIDEYKGELYRMNLSCSGGGLSGSECLFFKVGGSTNVINAKFNSAVQGTVLQNDLTEPEIHNNTTAVGSEAISHGLTIINESVTNTTTVIPDISTSAVTSNLLLYVILGAAGGILILLIIIPILCGIIYCLASGKSCITPTPTQNLIEIAIQDQNRQEEHLCLGNFLNSNFDRIVVINEAESEYAHINEGEQETLQKQTSFVNSVKLQVEKNEIEDKRVQGQRDACMIANNRTSAAALRRTQSQEDNLDVVTVETFKPKLKEKRSISWSSAWETSTLATSRSVDRELSQVYDTVKPVAKVRDERSLGFNRLCHPGYSRQESLPSFSDVPSTSMLYASLYADTCSEYGSAYDVPRKAALTYSVPDVKKKREKKQENKEESQYEATINPEETLMFDDYKGHYDIPKCKYTADEENSANSNISSLYDQPRISKINLGN